MSLLILYILSVVTFILIRRFFYPEPASWLIFFCVSTTLLVFAWKYFNRRGLVIMHMSSTFFQKYLPKRERVFMLAFGYFAMPVWNFFKVSVEDLWSSVVVFAFISFLIYQECSKDKNDK
jgi:uncharacterized protein YhhL (DUF1145 family)